LRVTGRAHDERHLAPPGELALGLRRVEGSLFLVGEGERPHVADHAHDRHPLHVVRACPAHALPDRVFLRPEASRHGVVDDGYERGAGPIGGLDAASLEDGDAHRPEVARGHRPVGDVRLVLRGDRLALDGQIVRRVEVGHEWQVSGGPG
jgi:hypothetical protein